MILLYGPHCTDSFCGPQHPDNSINKVFSFFIFISTKTHKHTKKNHGNFCHCPEDFPHVVQIDYSLFDSVMKILGMLLFTIEERENGILCQKQKGVGC
jgi:hypothetical protein